MHCVMWTYSVPPELDEDAIRRLFVGVVGNYLSVPGLVRKYFGLTEDARSVVGIYLWESRAAADAFYTPEWMADVVERWGTEPARGDWVVPVVAETALRAVVAGS